MTIAQPPKRLSGGLGRRLSRWRIENGDEWNIKNGLENNPKKRIYSVCDKLATLSSASTLVLLAR